MSENNYKNTNKKKNLVILPGSKLGGWIANQDFHLSTAKNLSGRRNKEFANL